MSLQSDLARNRAIFEALTGAAATADSAELRSVRRASVPVRERAESAPRKLQSDGESRTEPAVQSFSLTRGIGRETGMALGFKAPDSVEYPELQKPAHMSSPDPLESFYHQIEVGARMSSQLLHEEEF